MTASTMQTEKLPAVSICAFIDRICTPRPSCAPTNSPTIAPTTAKTAAMSSPAKMKGRALGNFTFQKICQRDADSERSSSIRSRSTPWNPAMLLTSSGKKVSSATITTFDVMS